jgi:hypothetical protein
MVLRTPRQEAVLASSAAEAEAPMLVRNEPEFSTTVCTAVLILCHEILVYSNVPVQPC